MKNFSNILQPLLLTATTVATSFAILQSAPAQAVNLVTNGNFETGDFTGYTLTNTNDTFVSLGANGTQTAFLGKVGDLGSLSQILNTVAGQSYTLGYDLLSDGGTPNQFQVQVNGNTLFNQINIPAQPFTSYSFNFVGTGSDTLQFNQRNDPSYLQLDNVVVDGTASTAVPEPFTIIGTLIGGTAALRMRKKLKGKVFKLPECI